MKRLDGASIPHGVVSVLRTLRDRGYAAFLVGGCVRDLLLGDAPHDYDVATDARPDEIERCFERTVPIGVAFGTVLVVMESETVEVTTFRTDLEYGDGRRPEGVRFGTTVTEDLARRDFTVNAIAWDPLDRELVDPFDGRSDLDERLIRAVGDPEARFREDALRMLRAIRFAAQLGFHIEPETMRAIELQAEGVRRLSAERVRDELLRMLATERADMALWLMKETGLLALILPELKEAERLAQHKRGAPTLLDHLIQAVAACPNDPILRMAALLHDIGKLTTRKVEPTGRVTFHNHPDEGARIVEAIVGRLRFPKREQERITALIKMHMAPHNQLAPKTLRRWVGRYGEPFVRDLFHLARADHLASGWEEGPSQLPALEEELEKIVRAEEGITLRTLAVDGNDVMRVLGMAPGPEVGRILKELHEMVLDDPSLNQRERLLQELEARSRSTS